MARSTFATAALAGVPLAVAFCAAPTRAQERLHFELMPDAELHATTLGHRRSAAPSKPEVRFSVLAGASLARASDDRARALFTPFVSAGLGVFGDAAHQLQLHSELAQPTVDGARADLGGGFEGSHRARAIYGLGDDKGVGVDLEGQGDVTHGARETLSFLRRDVPLGPFRDAHATLTLRPRVHDDNKSAFGLAASYTLRRVDFGLDGARSGYTTQGAGAGFGLIGYDPESTREWLEILGVGVEKTQFDQGADADTNFSRLATLDRVDLRLLTMDMAMAASRDVAVFVAWSLGAAWLREPLTRQAISTMTGGLSVRVRHDMDTHRVHAMDLGFGFARRAGFLADGSAMTRGWRLEGIAEVTFMARRIGGSIRMAVEQLETFAPGAHETVDGGWRSAIASETFFAPLAGVELGASHVVTDRCTPATIATPGELCHVLGVFLRLRGDTPGEASERSPEAQSSTEGRDRDDDGALPP